MKKVDNFRIEFYRKKRLRKNIRRQQKPIISNTHRRRELERVRFTNTAPDNFNFIDNTDEMLDFFERGRQKLWQKIPVKCDLRSVTCLTPDAIAIFASLFTDETYSNGTHLEGNAPRIKELKNKFLGSGFYNHVHSMRKPKIEEHNFLLHKISNKKTDPRLAKTATDFAAKFTFKDNRKFRPVYEIIIELMANTNNHASPDRLGVYEWWLYVFYDKETNITSYSFLDFGVGIFKSKPFLKYLIDLKLLTIGIKKDYSELASDLLEGRITSRTGLNERGRGFTCITKNAEHPAFKKFVLISNNVYIDILTKSSRELANDFSGTFAYWEVGDEN